MRTITLPSLPGVKPPRIPRPKIPRPVAIANMSAKAPPSPSSPYAKPPSVHIEDPNIDELGDIV